MLTHSPLIAFIPTKDAALARRFYEKILGLRFLSDDSFAIVMDTNGTMVRVEDFTPFPSRSSAGRSTTSTRSSRR